MDNRLMTRRQLLQQAIATSFLSLSTMAWAKDPMLLGADKAQKDNLGGAIKPYNMVGNFKDDRHRVFMFLSYDCPYCKETWKAFTEWSRTLPEPFQFVYVPLSKGKTHLELASYAFYVVRDLAPNKMVAFNQIAFEKAVSISRWEEWQSILQRYLQLSASSISGSLNKEITSRRVERARKLAKRYGVSATPYFAIGGKFTTHAGFTNGNYQVLSQLINALVSECIGSANF